MIKFFRKIRRNLLSQGKTGTYFKYAIGEIILVVIGILIALKINTWQMEKDDRKTEISLLKNIKSDLENDIREYRSVREFKLAQNEAAVRLLDYMIDRSRPLRDTVQFVNDFQLVIYFIVPSSNRTSFDLAVNTGYMNNITNENLAREVSRYYNNMGLEQHVLETKRFTNAYNENYLINKYPMFSNKVMALDGQGGTYRLEQYGRDKRPVIQPDDIRGDLSLENYFNELSIRMKIGILGLEKEEKWAMELIKTIDHELGEMME